MSANKNLWISTDLITGDIYSYTQPTYPSVNETDPVKYIEFSEYEVRDSGLRSAIKKIKELRQVIEVLAHKVDHELLLDEKLADGWTHLREAVVEARKALE